MTLGPWAGEGPIVCSGTGVTQEQACTEVQVQSLLLPGWGRRSFLLLLRWAWGLQPSAGLTEFVKPSGNGSDKKWIVFGEVVVVFVWWVNELKVWVMDLVQVAGKTLRQKTGPNMLPSCPWSLLQHDPVVGMDVSVGELWSFGTPSNLQLGQVCISSVRWLCQSPKQIFILSNPDLTFKILSVKAWIEAARGLNKQQTLVTAPNSVPPLVWLSQVFQSGERHVLRWVRGMFVGFFCLLQNRFLMCCLCCPYPG